MVIQELFRYPSSGIDCFKICKTWPNDKRAEFFRAVVDFSDLKYMLSFVIKNPVGTYPHLEVEIRERFRGFFIDSLKHDDKDLGFWISVILRSQKTLAHQGKLFMIMFGPTGVNTNREIIVDWTLFSNYAVHSHGFALRLLGPLADGLQQLLGTAALGKYAWHDHHVFALIEEITSTVFY
ncbi:unnamed protein product [Gongylonema pulchrum]|uniref:AAA_lid_1 domain-containing protein n=1 Tax=Gongylonema pulchrum TaxID=637853 RepID=A0A183E2H4_9BILA|nr:unnamed protein product [Gongylonema pulchrum]